VAKFVKLLAVASGEDEESDGLVNGGISTMIFKDDELLSTDDVIEFARAVDGHALARQVIRLRFLGRDDPEVYIDRDLCYGDCDDDHVDGHDECVGIDDGREQSRFEVKCLDEELDAKILIPFDLDDVELFGMTSLGGVDFSVQLSGCHDDVDYYSSTIYMLRVE
jgi:hypothetical protein